MSVKKFSGVSLPKVVKPVAPPTKDLPKDGTGKTAPGAPDPGCRTPEDAARLNEGPKAGIKMGGPGASGPASSVGGTLGVEARQEDKAALKGAVESLAGSTEASGEEASDGATE